MQDAALYRRLRDAVDHAVDQAWEGAEVDVGICPDKGIITLTGRVSSRGVQILIEDAVGRLAGDFTIVNQVKVEPLLCHRAVRFH
ncbi:BON domain-containing protein [Ancylobacter rudongensis]|uniref:BON domain-containing protein n=1 Tax=Ancylobacter rudongensis TaxID=177413 RepID=A0A1G4SK91_9HYPH|nr:BON domain-containing protein [Ancylobacter rudongensis]SCW69471.1 hypothetical protein SAMN05660859_2279 [Ancylobacter rudongensis]